MHEREIKAKNERQKEMKRTSRLTPLTPISLYQRERKITSENRQIV